VIEMSYLDDIKLYAVRTHREADEAGRRGDRDVAATLRQRAKMADRDVFMLRPGVEGKDARFVARHLGLFREARAAGMLRDALDPDLEPPPPPVLPPSRSAGWSEDGTTLRVWKSRWDSEAWRADSRDLAKAKETGVRVEVLEDRPGEPFRVTRAQMRDPSWCAANNRRRSEAMRAGTLEVVD
jgi:hypothetical protein